MNNIFIYSSLPCFTQLCYEKYDFFLLSSVETMNKYSLPIATTGILFFYVPKKKTKHVIGRRVYVRLSYLCSIKYIVYIGSIYTPNTFQIKTGITHPQLYITVYGNALRRAPDGHRASGASVPSPPHTPL